MREYNRTAISLSEIEYHNTRLLNITMRINDVCNLKCEYCHWHSYVNYEINDIIKTIDNLYKYLELRKVKKYTLYFHGGEPTYHPKVIEILKYFREKDKEYNIVSEIEMQTNFSLSKKHYLKILELVDYLSISFHYKELIRLNILDTFLSNLEILTPKNLLNFDIMLESFNTKEQREEFYNYTITNILPIAKFAKQSEMIYGFFNYDLGDDNLSSHKIFYEKYNISSSNYQYSSDKKNTNELFIEGKDFSGCKCDAGKNDLIINGNGDVFYCASHLTNNLNYLQKLEYQGKIDPIYSLLDEKNIKKLLIISKIGTTCQWSSCCGDFYISREENE